MNIEEELKKRNMNIHTCSVLSGIPYGTLYPIIKGKVDLGTCSYYTVEKLANVLGYRPDEIVYHPQEFQTFRNNIHHYILRGEVETILEIVEHRRAEYYAAHNDYRKALYLVALVDMLSKKNDIPLSNQYSNLRKMKLEEPYYVGDKNRYIGNKNEGLKEFAKYNIIEGDIYDSV